jgi:bacterioferritin-associated ferredoxin
MIVCSCRGLTDHQVREACGREGCAPSRPSEVHQCLGCARECGRCLRTINEIMKESAPPSVLDTDALIRMDAAE